MRQKIPDRRGAIDHMVRYAGSVSQGSALGAYSQLALQSFSPHNQAVNGSRVWTEFPITLSVSDKYKVKLPMRDALTIGLTHLVGETPLSVKFHAWSGSEKPTYKISYEFTLQPGAEVTFIPIHMWNDAPCGRRMTDVGCSQTCEQSKETTEKGKALKFKSFGDFKEYRCPESSYVLQYYDQYTFDLSRVWYKITSLNTLVKGREGAQMAV